MSDAEQELSVPEERLIEQRIVPFEGDDLTAALVETGDIYVSVPGMCAALSLNAQAQQRRMNRSQSLAKGLRRIPLKTPRRGTQMTYCLRIDRVALWLAGIETEKVKEEYRTKIEQYQDELAPVAMRVFMRVMGIPATPPATADPRMAALRNNTMC
jgi:hypothetical protein